MRGKHALATVGVLAALTLPTGCGGGALPGDASPGQADGERPATGRIAEEPSSGGDAPGERAADAGRRGDDAVSVDGDSGVRAGDVVAGGDSGVRAGDVVVGAGDGGQVEDVSGGDQPGRVVLKIKGDDGARYSGRCSVGDEKREIGGQAPERYVFEPDDEKLECEVGAKGAGSLNIVLAAGDEVRSAQQSGAGGSKVDLTYSEGRVSVVQSSSGAGSQVRSSSTSGVSSSEDSGP